MENITDVEQLKTKMFDAVEKMTLADLNEQICLAHQDFNTAAFWTNESKKAWKESEDLRIKINEILGDQTW